MPTVLSVEGLRFVIWPNDHPPPHVHVFAAGAEAKIELGVAGSHPTLIENRRMRSPDLVKALKTVFRHQELLRQKWREIHG